MFDANHNHGSATTRELAPIADWSEMGETEHFVQFYDTDEFLLNSLSGYIGMGLSLGDASIVVATRAHRESLDKRLQDYGLDVFAARASGKYIQLDAAETLAQFMEGGQPDVGRFADVVGSLVTRAAGSGRRVRIFGEMVALLWGQGNMDAALRLEALWNDLRKTHRYVLFCAYPMRACAGDALADSFKGVCASHSRVIPAESYVALPNSDERLRAIIELQQKAASLEAEVAERREAETALRAIKEKLEIQVAEAERANRMKDEFLATVSHELRTPLTAILGWAHMLRTGQFGGDSVLKAFETIERNARAQSQLIDDLLDVSRIITGKLRIDVRQLDPNSFVEAAVEAVRPAAEAKGVRVQKIMDTGVVTVSGDPVRLQQVVWNLLSNAIKFTPRGGRVQVRLERVNSHIEIAVTDTGAGIAPDFLPHVFDRFRQADQRTTRQHGGMGLGLAIVRHLVELHGGTVRAESAGEGQGATFTVLLPVAPVYQAAAEGVRVHPAARETLPSFDCADRLDGLRVLVVDDERDTRELLQAGLGQCGAEVTVAGSAAEALAAMRAAAPDLLISDIGMPEEDGYTLIRRVRALPAEGGGRVPAIALTAYARVEDRMQALRAGYQMHVPKPVEMAELVAVAASLALRGR